MQGTITTDVVSQQLSRVELAHWMFLLLLAQAWDQQQRMYRVRLVLDLGVAAGPPDAALLAEAEADAGEQQM